MEYIVRNKTELKRAYDEKAETIIVVGEFAEKMKKLMPFAKINHDEATEVVEISSAASLSLATGLAISSIILACSIGIVLIISLFRDYKTEIDTQISKKEIRIKFTRKK